MKATEQYFPAVLFIMLYMVVLTSESVNGKSLSVTIQRRAIKQYFPVVLFIMSLILCCAVVLTFASVDEFLKCEHSCGRY